MTQYTKKYACPAKDNGETGELAYIYRTLLRRAQLIDAFYISRKRELLQEYFTLLGALEYNIHQMKVQQKVLDDLVDIVITVSFFYKILIAFSHVGILTVVKARHGDN